MQYIILNRIFLKNCTICIIFISFLACPQFSGRDKLSHYLMAIGARIATNKQLFMTLWNITFYVKKISGVFLGP